MTLLESPTGTTLGLFLIQVVIVLTVVRFLGTTLRRIKQPMVIGEILAGICLGPSVLGWIPGFTDTFFPPQSMPYISLIAQVALIFFMFFLGMECDVKLMVSKWRSALPIAATSILVPFFVGMALSAFLITYEIPEPEVPINYYLFMGISFSFTALPVLARILTGAGLVTHPLGVQALAAAAVDDVLAWCTLALVLSYVNGGGIVAGLGTAVITAVFVCFLVFLVRPLLRAIHKKLMDIDDELNSTFIFFIFVLLCIFSLFAEMAGIHAFFGAFIFGLVMPREGKFCEDFKPKLELLIVEFFLPLYFANSGIRTQIGALDSGELWGVALLVCVVACVATIFPVAVCTHFFNKNWRFCFAVGILMNTRGLIALIVINIGLDIGVLSARSFTLLILMALVTTFATSPLMHFFYIKHLPKSEQDKRAQAAHDAHHAHGHSSVDPDKSLAALITNVMISERQIDQADAPPRYISEVIEAAERSGQIRQGPAFEDEPSVSHDLEMATPARNDSSVLLDASTPVSDSPAGLNAEQALEKWKQERAMRFEQHDRLDQH